MMIDMHVHFFPTRIFEAIWNFFDHHGNGLWHVKYRLSGKALVEKIQEFGIARMTTLVYAHKPGLASFLNRFVYESAQEIPALLPFGTVFVGDSDYLKEAQKIFEEYRFLGIKLHPFVSQEMLDDPRFFPVYEMMEALSKILICHPGSAPVYTSTDGAKRLRKILSAFPKLKVVIAHCGSFEFKDYEHLADEFESVYFDTAMNCVKDTPFEHHHPGIAFFTQYGDRILFGSDFPNLPYAYPKQIEGLKAMNLGDRIECNIFSENAKRLMSPFILE